MPHATIAVVLGAAALAAQQAALTFEVASIRRQAQPFPSGIAEMMAAGASERPGGRFAGTHVTVERLIMFAYALQQPFEVVGGPEWIRRDYFEVEAKAASDVSTDELRLMVRSLLEDRFKLSVRRAPLRMDHYVLAPARADGQPGPYLLSAEDCSTFVKLPPRPATLATPRRLIGFCMPFRGLVSMVSSHLKVPVIDRTGFEGSWVFEAQFAGEPGVDATGGAADPALPPFAVALEEQLGLKLERAQAPVDVLVIDAVQPPTDN